LIIYNKPTQSPRNALRPKYYFGDGNDRLRCKKRGRGRGRGLEEEEESEDEEPAKEEEEEAERCRQRHVVGQVSKRGVLWPGIKQTIRERNDARFIIPKGNE
jgi:hypothetical protein